MTTVLVSFGLCFGLLAVLIAHCGAGGDKINSKTMLILRCAEDESNAADSPVDFAKVAEQAIHDQRLASSELRLLLRVESVKYAGKCQDLSYHLQILGYLNLSHVVVLQAAVQPQFCQLTTELAASLNKLLISPFCPMGTHSLSASLIPWKNLILATRSYLRYFNWKPVMIISDDTWRLFGLEFELTLLRQKVAVLHHMFLGQNLSEVQDMLENIKPSLKSIILCVTDPSPLQTVLQNWSLAYNPIIYVVPSTRSSFPPSPYFNFIVVPSTKSLNSIQSSNNVSDLALQETYHTVRVATSWLQNKTNFGFTSWAGGETFTFVRNNTDFSKQGNWQRNVNFTLKAWIPLTGRYESLLQAYGPFPGPNNSFSYTATAAVLEEFSETSTGNGSLESQSYRTAFQEWLRLWRLESQEMACDFANDGECFSSTQGNDPWLAQWPLLGMLIGMLLFMAVVTFLVVCTRWWLMKRRAVRGPNKILLFPSDLQLGNAQEIQRPDLLRRSVLSVHSVSKSHFRKESSARRCSRTQPLHDRLARYNGELVHLRYLNYQGSFEICTKSITLVTMLRTLRHDNVNNLAGLLVDPQRPALVWEYCSRGSLHDTLKKEDLALDWPFKLSLILDLVRGMRYLHNSVIKLHGFLTSNNCVIDARWVLKVTDYALSLCHDAQGTLYKDRTPKELLWTAPELLRDESLRLKGSQPGDVYSFSIVLQEIVLREEPYAMLDQSPEEIIAKLKTPPPLVRPSVSKGAAIPEVIQIMKQCWAEIPEGRPTFNEIYDTFKKLNQGRKVNIVDTMFEMLEKYSNNLEDLIQERTEQLELERKKTEQLLNRMLPSTVAEKLKLGISVEPEQYDEVTIYFSDIVGFTTISAYSTPFQVVDLLNDLYTCFDATICAYTVYKVETIGDAYMVVGGLPVVIPDHAEQIATMALDLLHEAGKFKIRHLPDTPLRLRIGLHTGPCCAGVVGLTMPRFCLFGDTVNMASRMESTGAAYRVHLSNTTHKKLEASGEFHLTYRGLTEVKGKGQAPTYWLTGKDGFTKPLPTPPPLKEHDHGLDVNLVAKLVHEESNGTEATEPPETS